MTQIVECQYVDRCFVVGSVEGYQEASQLFQMEANVQPDTVLEPNDVRVQVREAIQKGQITDAMLLLTTYYPVVLANDRELCFRLQVMY